MATSFQLQHLLLTVVGQQQQRTAATKKNEGNTKTDAQGVECIR